ncbi:MAG: benzoate/H(+) symporter BenE family transporter [Acidiferrobacterales bacterium]
MEPPSSPQSPPAKGHSVFQDFNAAALWAGLTAFVWYAFGTVPLHIAVSQQLDLTAAQTSSWIFIVWFSGAISSVALSIYYRQPLPITWTIPGLIYLGTLADRFSYAEMVGANLVAGVLIVLLGIVGIGARIMKWLPLPIIMGMFAGSILGYITRLVSATVEDMIVAGTAVAAYLIGRLIANPRVPPVGLAIIAGGIAVFLAERYTPTPIAWSLPAVSVPEMAFSMPAIIAVSMPMLVLAMGLGNVQGLGFLLSQGYRVPVNRVTVALGLNSIVNALFGGHPAIVARTGVAILASPDAGPPSGRYWANLIAATLTIAIAVAAMPVASLIGILPKSYIFVLAGLAILSSFQDALTKAFSETLRFGAVTAFAVAVTPFALAGITSAFWAVIAGLVASLLAERSQLLEHWRSQ